MLIYWARRENCKVFSFKKASYFICCKNWNKVVLSNSCEFSCFGVEIWRIISTERKRQYFPAPFLNVITEPNIAENLLWKNSKCFGKPYFLFTFLKYFKMLKYHLRSQKKTPKNTKLFTGTVIKYFVITALVRQHACFLGERTPEPY